MNTMSIRSYEDIQDSLRIRLMDMKSNKDKLENAVYEPVGCGFALVAYMELPEEIAVDGIANVPRSLAESSGFSTRRIMMDARIGSQAADFPRLSPIQEMLFGTKTGEVPQNLLIGGDVPEMPSLLVLTTEDGRLGASALYYNGIQERIGQIVGGDYYVLPSSVHEVLILPDDGHTNARELANMVKQINENEVSPEERLGNKVLHFRADLQKLQVAADMDHDKDRGKERG